MKSKRSGMDTGSVGANALCAKARGQDEVRAANLAARGPGLGRPAGETRRT